VAASLGRLQWPRLTFSHVPAATLRFGLLVAAVAFLCALAAPHIGLFRRLELTTWDIRLRLRGQRPSCANTCDEISPSYHEQISAALIGEGQVIKATIFSAQRV